MSIIGALLLSITATLAIAAPASASGTYYKIKLYGYDRCLDVRGVSYSDGALLQTYSCIAGAGNQKFYVNYKGAGTNLYQLIASHSGKCADVVGASAYWGTNIQQYACLGWGQANQVWARNVQFYNGSNAVVTWTGFVDWCLAAQNWNNGADIRQEDCTNTGRNYWEMIPA